MRKQFVLFCQEEKFILFFLFIYSFSIFFFSSTFSPLFPFNKWSDINIYYTIGKGLVNGLTPYIDLFDHKGPCIFFIYALGYILTPDSYTGMYILESTIFFISLIFIYLISRLFLSKYYSLIVLILFPFSFFSYTWYGGAAEEFVVLFQIISLYFFVKYFKSKDVFHSFIEMFCHGLFLGLVFYIKFNLVIFWISPLFYICFTLINNKLWMNFLHNIFFFFLGFCVVTSLFVIYFLYKNSFVEFLNSYFVFNYLYGKQQVITDIDYCTLFYNRSVELFYRSIYVQFPVILFGFLYFFFSSTLHKKWGLLTIYMSFLFTSIILLLGSYLYEYYYIIFSVYTILGILSLVILITKLFRLKDNKILFLLFVLPCFYKAITYKEFFWFSLDTLITQNFPESMESRFSRKITKSEHLDLLCLGNDESLTVFTLAKVVPNVKYFFHPNISSSSYPDIRNEQINYIKNNEINFVILTNKDTINYIFFEKLLLDSGYTLVDSFNDNFTYDLYSLE